MDAKKFFLGALAAFVGMFVASWLVYGIILAGYYEEAFRAIEPREQPLMGILIVMQLGLALIMAFMYPKGYKGGSPAGEGLRFGILMGLFASITADLGLYAYMPIAFTPVFLDLIVFTIIVAIGGLLIGVVYGKPEAAEEKAVEPEPAAPAAE